MWELPLMPFILNDYDRLEHGIYNISRMRESATKRYKVFQIPVDWMLDSGYVSQVISILCLTVASVVGLI